MANVLDYNIVVNEFVSNHDIVVTFGLIPMGEAWNTLSLPFFKDCLCIKYLMKVDMSLKKETKTEVQISVEWNVSHYLILFYFHTGFKIRRSKLIEKKTRTRTK